MKKHLLTILLVGAAVPAFAQDFVAPVRRVPAPRETRVVQPRPTEGSLQRATRNGNLLQAINPFAPREYGSGADFVSHMEHDPFTSPHGGTPRPVAVRLVAVEFW